MTWVARRGTEPSQAVLLSCWFLCATRPCSPAPTRPRFAPAVVWRFLGSARLLGTDGHGFDQGHLDRVAGKFRFKYQWPARS